MQSVKLIYFVFGEFWSTREKDILRDDLERTVKCEIT